MKFDGFTTKELRQEIDRRVRMARLERAKPCQHCGRPVLPGEFPSDTVHLSPNGYESGIYCHPLTRAQVG